MILETKALTKRFGRLVAVNNLDMQVEEGMVFGLLGPNGSGKTTTLGIILDVLKASGGKYFWFGQPPHKEIRKKIGAILEHPCFYPYLSGWQNLAVVCKIKDCSFSRIDEVLEIVDLYDRKDDRFKTYSLGMKQRLAIASSLLSDPNVMILDEPTNGLDPQGIVEIREIIRQIAAQGKTIILASHLLVEVQKVCSHFMVLNKGQKLYSGSVKEALSEQESVELAASDMEKLSSSLKNFQGLHHLQKLDGKLKVRLQPEFNIEMLNAYLIQQGIVLTHLVETGGNLETQFLKILEEND